MNLMQVHANNVDALKIIYSSLVILSKVFYSLNFQVSKIIIKYKILHFFFIKIIYFIFRIYPNFSKTIWLHG